jgi:indole-3-glycerol phosphate synthase
MMATQTILDEITRWKREEIARSKSAMPLETVQAEMAVAPPPRDFAVALRPSGVSDVAPPLSGKGSVRLIAEVKRASPSKGLLHPDLDAVALARTYEACGAAAISVLTDSRFFQGSLDDLRAVRQHVGLPVLRKDFILDPYQVYEARAFGADAVLLIVAALSDGDLRMLYQLVHRLGMAALVEVHNEAELERALEIDPRIVGINNRDLRTFEVDLGTTVRLRPMVPADVILVAESGVHARADVARLAAAGVDGILVGEALIRAKHLEGKIRELIG